MQDYKYPLLLQLSFECDGDTELIVILKSIKKQNCDFTVYHLKAEYFFLCHQKLLQQATSTSNQGSFNGLQRLGGELILSEVDTFLNHPVKFIKHTLFMSPTM